MNLPKEYEIHIMGLAEGVNIVYCNLKYVKILLDRVSNLNFILYSKIALHGLADNLICYLLIFNSSFSC